MANYKQNLHSWLLVSYLQAFTDLWIRRVCRFNFCESGLLDWSDIRHGFCLAHCFVFVIGGSYSKHVGLEFHLGDNYIVFENFTASIGDLTQQGSQWTDICDHQISNWCSEIFKYNTVIS